MTAFKKASLLCLRANFKGLAHSFVTRGFLQHTYRVSQNSRLFFLVCLRIREVSDTKSVGAASGQ